MTIYIDHTIWHSRNSKLNYLRQVDHMQWACMCANGKWQFGGCALTVPHYNHEVHHHDSSAAPNVWQIHLQIHREKVDAFTSLYFDKLYFNVEDST